MRVPINCPACATAIHYRTPERPALDVPQVLKCGHCGHVLTDGEIHEQAQAYAKVLMKNTKLR